MTHNRPTPFDPFQRSASEAAVASHTTEVTMKVQKLQTTRHDPFQRTAAPEEQKRALLQSANNWFLLRWKTDRPMESRAHGFDTLTHRLQSSGARLSHAADFIRPPPLSARCDPARGLALRALHLELP